MRLADRETVSSLAFSAPILEEEEEEDLLAEEDATEFGDNGGDVVAEPTLPSSSTPKLMSGALAAKFEALKNKKRRRLGLDGGIEVTLASDASDRRLAREAAVLAEAEIAAARRAVAELEGLLLVAAQQQQTRHESDAEGEGDEDEGDGGEGGVVGDDEPALARRQFPDLPLPLIVTVAKEGPLLDDEGEEDEGEQELETQNTTATTSSNRDDGSTE